MVAFTNIVGTSSTPRDTVGVESPRFVFLDPDGSMAGGWLFVIVEANTGVVYQTEYGGTATRTGQTEGFLVPLTAGEALDALCGLFEVEFRGSGTCSHPWPVGPRDRLREIIGSIRYWAGDKDVQLPYHLELDESRIYEVDEAWVPVITPDGRGVLMWRNSD
jgi:Family of unknown function (DUF6210)